jgi:hypothetical protein
MGSSLSSNEQPTKIAASFFATRHTRGRARRAARMEAILDQQAELLRVGEELIRESSRKLRDAAGPDALRQAYELYRGFFEAVDWTEPWLVAVLSLHAMLLLVAVATRKSETAQTCVFALCAFLVFIAERLNGLASAALARVQHAGLLRQRGRLHHDGVLRPPHRGARGGARELPAAHGVDDDPGEARAAEAARARGGEEGEVTRYARTNGGVQS